MLYLIKNTKLVVVFGVFFAIAGALPDRSVAVPGRDGPGGRLRTKVGAFCRREAELPELYELAVLAYGEAKPGWSGGVVRKLEIKTISDSIFANCILHNEQIRNIPSWQNLT